MGCLYLVVGPNGKWYVGITQRSVEERWREHQKSNSGCLALYRAIKKYGPERFNLKVLVMAGDWDYLCALERRAISKYGTLGNGYNLTPGGDGVVGMAEESKRRHRVNTSIGSKLAWGNAGTREKRAATFKTEEFRERHSAATAAGVRATYLRPEVRANLSASMTSERKASIARRVSEKWTDPVYRARQVAARIGRRTRTVESKIAQGNKMRAIIAARKAAGTYWR